ncbi:MAG: ABC transporter ATP-binding protein [Pseudomonadota bacterium]
MTQISVRSLCKEYDDKCILENVNVELPDHEFCMVLGPSGAGKSTFLRILLSMEEPTRGKVLIDGEPIDAEPQPDRGVVFQRYSVFPHMTALQNVMIGPQLRDGNWFTRLGGAKKKELRERALALLGEVGLGDAGDKFPSQLSGGMQQRLAIAQALIMEPKVLLLDEPFGALDISTKRSMHQLILDLWERNKMTIVMVTHDIQEAFTLGTRILMVDKKRDDPHAPEAFGSTITSDLRLDPSRRPPLAVVDDEAQDSDDAGSMREIFARWTRDAADAIVSTGGADNEPSDKRQAG